MKSGSWAVFAVAAVAAVAGAAAGAHPAGWRPADLILTGAFAALVTVAGSVGSRWTWFVLSGVAAVAASGPFATACGVAALVLALACAVLDRESALEGAVIAGLAVQALLRLRDFGFHGAPSIVAALAVLPLLVSAYRASTDGAQHVVRRVGLVLGIVAVIGVGLAGVAGLQARDRIQQAVRQARAGFDAAQNGDRDAAMGQLSAAESSFGSVSDLVDAWWAQPVRVVPVAGQQMAAVQAMADEGRTLAHTAANGVATIDYEQLRVRGGAIDLAMLAAARQPVTDAVDALDDASDHLGTVSQDWLVPPIRDRYDQLAREIARTLPPARNARDVVALGPEFLGATTPKHYVVLFGTPSESRELGGLVGNYAEVTADKGKLTLTRSGRSIELSDRDGTRGVTLRPESYLERFTPYQVTRFFQNVSASPNFPEVADVTMQVYLQIFGQQVDGVFYMDPISLAALLELTGPVHLEESNVTLDAQNAAKVLLVDQYVNASNTEERVDFLDEATRLTFEKLTTGDLPKPAQVSDVMTPMVEQGRVLAFSPSGDLEALFRTLGMDGTFPDPHNGDFLYVTEANAGANKIDAYMQRTMTYNATYQPDTGEVQSTVHMQLTNSAPAGGLPDIVLANIHDLPPGTNQMLVTVYSPLAAAGATVNGVQAPMQSVDRFGLHSYTVEVEVPPGGTVDLELALRGAVAPSVDYRLTLAQQPIVNPDRIDVAVSGADGWKVTGSGTLSAENLRTEVFRARFAQ
jgi:hypothetical protein